MENVLVWTDRGLMDRSRLEVRDVITWEGNFRVIRTEWYFEGKLVRRDVLANMLVGQSLSAMQEGS